MPGLGPTESLEQDPSMPDTSSTAQAGFSPVSVSLGTARLSAQVGGAGRPLVLLHSLLADRTSFDRVAPALAATHRVIALDLPGFEGSDAAEGGLEAVADRVAQALAAMRLDQKPILLGNGYGGFVALLTAIRHPGLAERLVLADCGASFSEPGRAAFRGMSAAAEKGGLTAIADVAMRRLFAPEYQALHPELIAQRKARFLAIDPGTFHGACAALAALDLRPRLAELKLPVLVLVGEMDEATPPPMSKELAAGLPDARLVVLPGCAHVPQLQAPEAFLAAISGFLAESRAA
jgi:3-oxoadipate enol-lactonase